MNFKYLGNKIINFFLIPLLAVSLCGSISLLPALIQLFPNHPFVIFVVILIFLYLGYQYINKKCINIFKIGSVRKYLIIIMILVTLTWQVMLVRSLSSNFGWDPRLPIEYILNSQLKGEIDKIYFSMYPNNFLLLCIEKFVQVVFGIKSSNTLILYLNFLNIIIIDLAALILFFAVKRLFNNRTAYYVVGIYWMIYMIWPFVVIPYSDNWAVLLGCIFLYIYSLNSKFNSLWINALFGFFVAFALFMKPSTIIFVIAICVVKLIFTLDKIKKLKVKKVVVALASLMLGFSIFYVPMKYYQAHNNLVNLDESRKMQATHFIAMGMSASGGFEANDIYTNIAIKNPKKRNAYNVKLIKDRLSKRGLGGYLKFLVQKQINNTSDGAFGWSYEGLYLYSPFVNSLNNLEKKQRTLFMYKESKEGFLIADPNMSGYKLLPQLIWVIVLLMAFITSVKSNRQNIQLLKCTILGGFIFLLLFEGGRSRYLIQFLPYIITLASVGIDKCIVHRHTVSLK